MTSKRPLPIDEIWGEPDAYIEALLSFSTTSVLFMNLCGGVHMVDFLTREPDVYTTLLPENWRSFFDQHDVQQIIDLLLREDIDHLRGIQRPTADQASLTWNGAAFPPQTLLDYISSVRRLTLRRDLCTPPSKSIDLPTQVAMRMNRKKAHEVQCFSQYVASLSDTVHEYRGEPISHIVDFGSGQNYLGRTLASPPYHKHIIAIERKHQYITGAKGMDVRAKLAVDPKALYIQRSKNDIDCANETTKETATETTNTPLLVETNLQVLDSENATAPNILDEITLGPDDVLGSTTKGQIRERAPRPEIDSRGNISYIEHEIEDGYLEHITNPVIKSSSLEFSNETAEKTNARLMVVSVHSCGNLLHHGVRSLILNPSVVAIAMVGCCYNLMTERLGPVKQQLSIFHSQHPRLEETSSSYDSHGFPMSKYYESYETPGTTSGIRLNITARALAVQAPHNWTVKASEVSFTRHFFRALLQRILVDRGVLPNCPGPGSPSGSNTSTLIIGSLPKAAFKSFSAYFRAATNKMSQDPVYGSKIQEHVDTLSDNEIHEYEDRYSQTRKYVSVLWSLVAFSAQVVESLIVVDRWQFLREQDLVKECWIEPVFDYGQSPRNLAIVGLKK
ncbi:hypothetical protein N7478_007379 [Penicillium angulare]|uniref:uncharacterized protein n=1 Tax=Penicillium angulare TaxID=116970 RepID=UPI002540CF3B|nr:uncharacterized protein N7478_007379 [Penicillium angulare]KAJ5282007.1 hypothetical protein N7478_007379 [Penicillium angulare]